MAPGGSGAYGILRKDNNFMPLRDNGWSINMAGGVMIPLDKDIGVYCMDEDSPAQATLQQASGADGTRPRG